ncbi:MAG: DtxR family Mn-dependent transcriptional regulator [Natronomonas sp.]|jgi:DtxR family Mn-dependent transcriptional regulator|uniref:metal-dependent transcriptional regulator n=1 Tax=Natronomonas sp. TaxID=2184060 RepID=UPI003989F5AE
MASSPVVEDTLKTIYHLQQEESPPVSTSDIADRLDKAQATVTSTLDRLEAQGLIAREPYHGSELTDDGKTVAVEVLRHHRLLETYLAEYLDYPWEQVHEEADRLEHHISEEFERRLAETLENPRRDPHGDPIPGKDLEPPNQDPTTPLSACEVGDRVVITRVSDRDEDDLAYLADVGITPGTAVRIVDVAPFGMITLEVDDTEQAVPGGVAASIRVTPLNDDDPASVEQRGDA